MANFEIEIKTSDGWCKIRGEGKDVFCTAIVSAIAAAARHPGVGTPGVRSGDSLERPAVASALTNDRESHTGPKPESRSDDQLRIGTAEPGGESEAGRSNAEGQHHE